MNIYYCNINKINEEVEDFVIAKNRIETPLIEDGTLEKKMSISEFLDYINISSNIFMGNDKKNTSIPFNIYYPTKTEIVIIYSLEEANEDIITIFKTQLEKINYNLDSLTELSQLEIFEGSIADKPYFILDNKFFIA